ncbi:MAG: hypothetical protein RLZZ488_546 [Pseudomonadota bacterium]
MIRMSFGKIEGEQAMTNDTKKRPADSEEEVRLNVFLQESGVASRRKADELIEAGFVKVNGKSVTQLGIRIRRSDKVHVHGKLLAVKNIPKVIFVLNKPDMCLTTRFDAKGRRTIFDLPAVKNLPPNVQAVGRLDYRSEGLLLLTNDGDLAYALTHPKFSVEKTYAVLVADGVTIEDVEKLRAGVMLDDGMAKAVSVRMGNKERMGASRGQWLELVVTEGRNRLIRRMTEAIGLKVVRLVRIGMGDVVLPATLKPGQALAVDASSRSQLEQIKSDMLLSLESGKTASAKAGAIDDATRAKRKLRRQLRLSDEEYEIESSRRSAEASVKRRQRNEQLRAVDAKSAGGDRPTPRPVSRDDARGSESAPRPVRRDDARRSETAPRPARRDDARRSESVPRPARRDDARRSESAPRPARRDDARRSESAPRPARRDDARRSESAPRPARREDARKSESPPRSTRRDGPRKTDSAPRSAQRDGARGSKSKGKPSGRKKST